MNKKIVIISTITLVIAQILKSIIELSNAHVNVLFDIIRLNYYENTGAAFSILQGKVPYLILISIIMLVIIYSMTFSYKETKITNISFGLLIGGVFGNLVDRVFYGFVRDFMDIKLFGYNFPVFNIADVAIVVGVGILLLVTLKGDSKNDNKSGGRNKLKNR